ADEWGIAVLFEHDRSEERRLQPMCARVAHDAAKAAQRGAPVRLLVVGQPIDIALNGEWRPQPRNQPTLARQKAVALSRHPPSRGYRRAPVPVSIHFPYRSA